MLKAMADRMGMMNGTLTLVPGESGALDCAIRYRPLYDKQPSGGVERLAGRMLLDIWGGKYAEIADRMDDMICYGLTDSLLTARPGARHGGGHAQGRRDLPRT